MGGRSLCLTVLVLLGLGLALAGSAIAENTAPTATIDLVSPEEAYTTQPLSFTGHGNDTDGTITAWWWGSDLDGNLSEAAAFTLTGLNPGTHTLTFRVRDDEGAWSANASRQLTVSPNSPPNLRVANLSAPRVMRGEALTLLANVSDDMTSPSDLAPDLEYRPPDWDFGGWSYPTGNLYSVALSADGEYLAAGSNDYRLFLFARGSNQPLWNFTVGAYPEVALSADGTYLAAKSWDRNLRLFHRASATPLWSFTAADKIYSVALSADGEYLAAGTRDHQIYLFHRSSSTPLWNYTTGGEVDALALSANGSYLAAGSWDDMVYLFGRQNNTPLWAYKTGGNVDAVALSANGSYLAAGSGDDKLYLFERSQGEPLWHFTAGRDVDAVALSADGSYLAAGSDDDNLYYFERQTETPLWVFHSGGAVETVDLSADGGLVAAGSRDDWFYLFQSRSPLPVWAAPAGGDVASLDLSARGESLVVGAREEHLRFYSRWQNADLQEAAYGSQGWSVNLSPAPQATLGNYDFRLRFSDEHGGLAPWVTLNLSARVTNRPPQAGLAPDNPHLVFDTQSLLLSGTGDDTDGDYLITGYQWYSNLEGLVSTRSTLAVADLRPGNHSLSFRVRDSDGAWSENLTFQLKVVANQPPQLTSFDLAASTLFRGQSLRVFLNASDDLDPAANLTFQFEYLADSWTPFEAASLNYSQDHWQARLDLPLTLPTGELLLRARAQDGHEGRGPWTAAATPLWLENNPPQASFASPPPPRANLSQPLTFSGGGSDVDGSLVGYLWNSSLDGTLSRQPAFTISNLSAGTHLIEYQVQDNDGTWSEPLSFSLTVNQPPSAFIDSVSPQRLTQGETVLLSGRGSDADGILTGYRWRSSLVGEVLSTEPTFSTSTLPAGNHTLSLAVRDDWGVWSAPVRVSLFVNARPSATLSNSTPTLVHQGQPVHLTYTATDPDGTLLATRWVSDLQGELELGPDSTIDTLQPGNHTLTLQVRDDFGAWSEPLSWSLRVNARPNLHHLRVTPQVAIQGEPVSLEIKGQDPDGLVKRYHWRLAHQTLELATDREYPAADPSPLTTDSLASGNYTLTLWLVDDQGGWSDPLYSWLYVNAPPVAVPLQASLVPTSQGPATVRLMARGLDDETIAAYQWRSDLVGLLATTSGPDLTLTNLTPGTHTLSVRVQDELGAWSPWVEWAEPLEVPAARPSSPLALAGLPLWILLVASASLMGSGWYYHTRVYAPQIRDPRNRLKELARLHEEVGMAYPRQPYQQVLASLVPGRHRRLASQRAALQRQMEQTLKLYQASQQVLAKAKQLRRQPLPATWEEKPTPGQVGALEEHLHDAFQLFDEAKELLAKAKQVATWTEGADSKDERPKRDS